MPGFLVVAAFPPELADLEGEVVGVGLVEAALGASRVIAARKPSGVVLVGTAGAYPNSGLAIGAVVVADAIVLAAASGALVEGAMPTSLETDGALSACFDATRARVATTLSITIDDDIARALEAATRASVEHLEAFAVARACAIANVPFTAVLGIANIVSSGGREAWRANHERAAAAARTVITCSAAFAARAKNRSTQPSRV